MPFDGVPRLGVLGLLVRARGVMVGRGKCDGVYEDGEGRVCILGALAIAAGAGCASDDMMGDPIFAGAVEALEGQSRPYLGLHLFNDQKDEATVLALFDRAIGALGEAGIEAVGASDV